MEKGKFMCNYHFVAECQDINPDLDGTECSGVSEKDSNAGFACKVWKNKMLEVKK